LLLFEAVAISPLAAPTQKRNAGSQQNQSEEAMNLLNTAMAAAVVLAMSVPAHAVTVKNTSAGEFTIGIDYGDTEKVETIAAGKEVKFDCKDDCGVTGPWGFSWMAKGDDVIASNCASLISVQEPGAAKK
jgi:hypothetical protein